MLRSWSCAALPLERERTREGPVSELRSPRGTWWHRNSATIQNWGPCRDGYHRLCGLDPVGPRAGTAPGWLEQTEGCSLQLCPLGKGCVSVTVAAPAATEPLGSGEPVLSQLSCVAHHSWVSCVPLHDSWRRGGLEQLSSKLRGHQVLHSWSTPGPFMSSVGRQQTATRGCPPSPSLPSTPRPPTGHWAWCHWFL